MKKHSCGAILYTIYNNSIYIVLGLEKGQWFPFKGTREKGETNVQAAVREIKEETCNALHVDHVDLKCHYSTKRKHYHIGLTRMTTDEFNQFYLNKYSMIHGCHPKGSHLEYNWAYIEKDDIRMFSIDSIMSNNFHEITYIPIRFYYQYLKKLQRDARNGIMIKNHKTVSKSPLYGPTNMDQVEPISIVSV